VRDVQLFERCEGGEVCDGSEAVGLDGQDAEVSQCIESLFHQLVFAAVPGEVRMYLEFRDFIFPQPQLLKRREVCDTLDLSNAVCTELQVPQLLERLQPLDFGNAVLHKVKIPQLCQGFESLDVLDIIEAQIEALQLGKCIETIDVADLVIVQIQLRECRG